MCYMTVLAAMLEPMKQGESREAIHEASAIIHMKYDGGLNQSNSSRQRKVASSGFADRADVREERKQGLIKPRDMSEQQEGCCCHLPRWRRVGEE